MKCIAEFTTFCTYVKMYTYLFDNVLSDISSQMAWLAVS